MTVTAERVLHVADGVDLPIEYVTKAAAILAQRRKGKTYTAAVIAEELVDLGIPWVALDPTGAWWGLRASADGEEAGLPVVVIGGQHGDLPLERGAGAFVADLVLDHPGYYVLDLSLLESRSAEREFATAFAKRLLRRKMQPGMDFPLHLFIDEADMFVPQEKEGVGDVAMLGAFQGIVRRGGLHGLGVTLISQRPALVNKSALTQLDLLVLLRLVAGNDQDAVDKNYISRASSKEQRAELMGSLASLPVGTAWFFEPGGEPPLFVRTKVRERRTFNSSATPKPGEQRIEPRVLADVDLDEIRNLMGEAIERAESEDPVKLRGRIADLERRLHDWSAGREALEPGSVEALPGWDTYFREQGWLPPDEQPEPVRVEVPVATIADLDAIWALITAAKASGDQLVDALREVAQPLAQAILDAAAAASKPTPSPVVPSRPVEPERSAAGIMADSRREAPATPPAPPTGAPTVELNRRAERAVLAVLAQFPQGRTVQQVALMAGYAAKGGGFRGALSKLRTHGLIEGASDLTITEAGKVAIAGQWEPLPKGAALLDYWLGQMKRAAERAVLQTVYDAYPGRISPADVAEATDYEAAGGGFRGAISKLRTLGLIEGSADLRAADSLFE